jgi:hypothetical protein
MAKTYRPGLYLVARALYTYITKWQTQIQAGSTTEEITALGECLACVTHLLTLYTKPPVSP